MWLRVNLQKKRPQTYRALLEEQGISAKTSHHPNALYLDIPIAVQNYRTLKKGCYGARFECSMGCDFAWAKNEEWILDACAAPGGKTTHILELAPQSNVIALDVETHRLKRVEENLARLNQQAIVVCGDASKP